MAYNQKLTNRVREALSELPNVEEKKMFCGVTFLLNRKTFVSVGENEMMWRIDLEVYETALEKTGCL
ncbi:MAG: hypothetical protein WKF91_03805 [Segetibacter sp.]